MHALAERGASKFARYRQLIATGEENACRFVQNLDTGVIDCIHPVRDIQMHWFKLQFSEGLLVVAPHIGCNATGQRSDDHLRSVHEVRKLTEYFHLAAATVFVTSDRQQSRHTSLTIAVIPVTASRHASSPYDCSSRETSPGKQPCRQPSDAFPQQKHP